MKNTCKKLILVVCAWGTSSVFAQASDHQIYAAVGLPGLVLGYAHPISQWLSLRADFGTTGSITRSEREDEIDYKGKLKYGRLGVFGDYFPVGGGFRLTAGFTLNETALTLDAQTQPGSTFTVNGKTIVLQGGDKFRAKADFPKFTPYIGLGWGHQKSDKGFGFVADFGASIGRARVRIDENISTNPAYAGAISAADVEVEKQKIRNGVAKVKFLPQISVGISYRF